MSNDVNDRLGDEARFYIELYEGTLIAELLESDLKTHDLDSLYSHLDEARRKAFDDEYNPKEVYKDEVH